MKKWQLWGDDFYCWSVEKQMCSRTMHIKASKRSSNFLGMRKLQWFHATLSVTHLHPQSRWKTPCVFKLNSSCVNIVNVTLYPDGMPAVYSVGIPALLLASDFEAQILNLEILDFQLAFISLKWNENQLVCMLFRCRSEKLWGNKTLDPKYTDTWKLKLCEDKWVIMNNNLQAGSMKQSRYNIFEQNPCLMKNSAKKCRALGLPSQQDINNKWDERDRECL